ncbi:MAG: hypothetical protein Q7N95_07285 [Alphaproteobacteria bacterium]|nr:hypothetical protein [Alphaproteobacteria bacterium]
MSKPIGRRNESARREQACPVDQRVSLLAGLVPFFFGLSLPDLQAAQCAAVAFGHQGDPLAWLKLNPQHGGALPLLQVAADAMTRINAHQRLVLPVKLQ